MFQSLKSKYDELRSSFAFDFKFQLAPLPLGIPCEHVLIFQTDARICEDSDKKLEDFMIFSMIGAGIGAHGRGLNSSTFRLDVSTCCWIHSSTLQLEMSALFVGLVG